MTRLLPARAPTNKTRMAQASASFVLAGLVMAIAAHTTLAATNTSPNVLGLDGLTVLSNNVADDTIITIGRAESNTRQLSRDDKELAKLIVLEDLFGPRDQADNRHSDASNRSSRLERLIVLEGLFGDAHKAQGQGFSHLEALIVLEGLFTGDSNGKVNTLHGNGMRVSKLEKLIILDDLFGS